MTTQAPSAAPSRAATGEFIISADSHIVEPADLWERRLPTKFRDRPEFVELTRRSTRDRSQERTVGEDPVQRIKDVATDGISAEVLYPNYAMTLFHLDDAEFQEACFETYNSWAVEYCQTVPDRLFAIGMLSLYNIDKAVRELERCKKLGLRGGMIWNVPPAEIPYTSARYDPFWAAAQELEMPLSLHVVTGHDYSKNMAGAKGLELYRTRTNHRLQSACNSLFDFIFSGVLERFPRLRLVLAENRIGWIPFALEQWDESIHKHANEPLPLTLLPSEYFYRQVYATFLEERVGSYLLGQWGEDNFMWSTDYPHKGNQTWPFSQKVISENLGHLTPEARRKILAENASRLYHLPVASPL